MISYGAGVHAAYEDSMIDYHVGELWPGVDPELRHWRQARCRRTARPRPRQSLP